MNIGFIIKTYLHRQDILYHHKKLINLWLDDESCMRDIKGEILAYKMFTSKPGELIKQILSHKQPSRQKESQ